MSLLTDVGSKAPQGLRVRHWVVGVCADGKPSTRGRIAAVAARGVAYFPTTDVAVAGASGLIGRALTASLSRPSIGNSFNPQVYSLVRRPPRHDGEIFWDPYEGRVDIDRLEGLDAIVNLAGENAGTGEGLLAFTGRWTDRKKHWIMESRRRGNMVLAQASAALTQPPKALVCMSGVGYYGSDLDGSKPLTEDDPKGAGFLAEVAARSEAELKPATAAGIRTVILRGGVVLSPNGGALERLLPPFKLGLGGPIGDGKQYMPWISLTDMVRAIEASIRREDVSGIYNAVAPTPATNREFAAALGRVLHRPAVLPVPAAVMRLVMGEFAEEALLSSIRAVPHRLTADGFRFRHDDIEEALRAELS